jgi:Transposase DDE domain
MTSRARDGEFFLGEFGDVRLARVGEDFLAALVEKRTVTLRRLSNDRAQEIQFSRFLHNEAVTAEEMLASAGKDAGGRAQGRDVLVIQDTTEINYADHADSKKGFGTVGNGKDIGLFMHPLLVVEAQTGGVLGLAGSIIMNRRRRVKTPAAQRPLKQKESRRWLQGAQIAGRGLGGAKSITVVADRESDIYEEFALRPAAVHLLTRAAQDRLSAEERHLFETVRDRPVAARYQIEVPAKGKRQPRQPMVTLRYTAVTLRRPSRCRAARVAAAVALHAVLVEEICAPHGEQAIQWLLLTTHDIATAGDAQRLVAWYRLRWIIEELNRTLKSQGMNVEASQIIKSSVMKKMCVAALIAAMQVIQLVRARDGRTRQQMTDGFDQDDQPLLEKLNQQHQGKTVKQQNPHRPGSLAWASWIIGRLGGWHGYYKPPGPKIMHIGLTRFHAMKHGWMLATGLKDV